MSCGGVAGWFAEAFIVCSRAAAGFLALELLVLFGHLRTIPHLFLAFARQVRELLTLSGRGLLHIVKSFPEFTIRFLQRNLGIDSQKSRNIYACEKKVANFFLDPRVSFSLPVR